MNKPANRRQSIRRIGGAAISALCIVYPLLAGAQTENAESGALQEIVVTAQKREQNLQDVGTSITAFDAKALSQMGMRDATDIVLQVPALQFNAFSPDLTVFNIRGVSQNDFSDHQEPPVAVYVDEGYVASPGAIAGALYDLARVEVLRGPQGTLFGRNATGGLIHYITQKPIDDFESDIEVTGGEFGLFTTRAVVNAPLNDRIDARFSFATDYHKGLIHNSVGPDTESQRQFAARLQLLFKLSDNGEYLIKFHGVHNNEVATTYAWGAAFPNSLGLGVPIGANENPLGTCNGCDLGGYLNTNTNPFNQAYARPDGGLFRRSLYGVTGDLNWKWSDVELTWITDFLHMEKRYGEDTDASPNFITWFDTNQRYRQFSQELRVSGLAGPIRWIAGLYYLNISSRDSELAQFPAFIGGNAGNQFDVETRSYAGFAQGEWAVTDHWTAILGARFTEDVKTDDYALNAAFGQPEFLFNRTLYPNLAHRTWGLPSGKAELDYKIDRDKMLYASVNRGVKGGGFAQAVTPPAIPPDQIGFGPEKLTSYEVGFKSILLDGHMRFNADAFYYDYRDYQAFEQRGVTTVIANLNARVKGGEVEWAFMPASGLEFDLGGSTLNTVVKNVVLPGGAVVDRVMPQSPKFSWNTRVRYEWSAWNATWSLSADTKSNTAQNFGVFNAPVTYSGGYTVANVRAGYKNAAGNLELAVFCNNVTNKYYPVYSYDFSSLGYYDRTYAPPRWAGVTVTYHWH